MPLAQEINKTDNKTTARHIFLILDKNGDVEI